MFCVPFLFIFVSAKIKIICVKQIRLYIIYYNNEGEEQWKKELNFAGKSLDISSDGKYIFLTYFERDGDALNLMVLDNMGNIIDNTLLETGIDKYYTIYSSVDINGDYFYIKCYKKTFIYKIKSNKVIFSTTKKIPHDVGSSICVLEDFDIVIAITLDFSSNTWDMF